MGSRQTHFRFVTNRNISTFLEKSLTNNRSKQEILDQQTTICPWNQKNPIYGKRRVFTLFSANFYYNIVAWMLKGAKSYHRIGLWMGNSRNQYRDASIGATLDVLRMPDSPRLSVHCYIVLEGVVKVRQGWLRPPHDLYIRLHGWGWWADSLCGAIVGENPY